VQICAIVIWQDMKVFKFIMRIWKKYKNQSNPFSEAIAKGIAEAMKGTG
jgi:hypothetical protein